MSCPNFDFDSSGELELFDKNTLVEMFERNDFKAVSSKLIDTCSENSDRKRKSTSSWCCGSEYKPAASKTKLELTRMPDTCKLHSRKHRQSVQKPFKSSDILIDFEGKWKSENSVEPSMLHTACKLFSTNYDVVESALALQPDSIRQRSKRSETGESKVIKNTWTREHYSLPINIALRSQASMDVLKLLVDADPSVLLLEDGYSGCASLCIALKSIEQKSLNLCTVLDLILSASPHSIRLTDRKMNFPLHVACFIGAPLDVVHYLYNKFPEALLRKNFYGATPLSIAERNMQCSEEVVNFLQRCSFGECPSSGTSGSILADKMSFTARSA